MYSTRTEAEQATIAAIEAGGAVTDAATEFAIDAIVDAAYEYSPEQGGFIQAVGAEDFWKLVETHAADVDPHDAPASDGEATSGEDQRIDEVIAAHQAVADAEQTVAERVAERASVVQRALDAGVGAQPIADALGVARPRVYRLAAPGKRSEAR